MLRIKKLSNDAVSYTHLALGHCPAQKEIEVMGLIKAAMGAASGVMGDQWKEYFYPAPGRRQPIYFTFRFRIDLCFC